MIDKEKLIRIAKAEGLALSADKAGKLDLLCQMLVRWNEKINLTSITEPEDMLYKHILDSLSVLYKGLVPEGASMIDVGCGAGFPGLPVAVVREDVSVTFLDSTAKKLSFIDEMINTLSIQKAGTFTLIGRAEELGHQKEYREVYDVAFARAMASPTQAMEYALPFVKKNGHMVVFLAGKDDKTLHDVTRAAKILCASVEEICSFRLGQTDIDRTLIKVKKLSQLPTKYPRNNQKISKNPL